MNFIIAEMILTVIFFSFLQDDAAKDAKLHVAQELSNYLTRSKKPKGGLAVMAVSLREWGGVHKFQTESIIIATLLFGVNTSRELAA